MNRSLKTLVVTVLALAMLINAGVAFAKPNNPNKPQKTPAPKAQITGVTLTLFDAAGNSLSSDGEYTIVSGLRYRVSAAVEPAGAKAHLTFRSSKPRVASVSNKGVIYCNKPGKATISVTARPGGIKQSLVINVVANAVSFETTADRTIRKLYLKGNTLYADVVLFNGSNEALKAAPSLAFFLKLSAESEETALGTKPGRIRKAIPAGESGIAVYKIGKINARKVSLLGATAYCKEP